LTGWKQKAAPLLRERRCWQRLQRINSGPTKRCTRPTTVPFDALSSLPAADDLVVLPSRGLSEIRNEYLQKFTITV